MNDSKTSSWQFLSADQISRVDAEDLLRAREHIANGVKAAGLG